MVTNYSAPGKLFISGEWSILETGTIGLVAAVDSRSYVSIDPLAGYDGISVSAEDFKIFDARAKFLNDKIVFINLDDKSKETLKLLSESISTALRYLKEKSILMQPFKLSTSSKDLQIIIDDKPRKIGFGSSAAVAAATIAAVLDFHAYSAGKDEIFKLAAIAHYSAQGKVGSGFDVAASVYGGIFAYSRFDPSWLSSNMESKKNLSAIVEESWPGLLVEKLELPETFNLIIGWTKEEASTIAMINQMNSFKANEPARYQKLIVDVASCAHSVVDAWHAGDWDRVVIELQNSRQALAELGRKSGVRIETPELARLSEIADSCGAAGKLSGAGGGDCGIAVCFDQEVAKNIKDSWEKAGITVLKNSVDVEGVRKE